MVTRTKNRLALCVGLLAAWLCVIWGNSMLPGQTSGAVSGWASTLIGKILPFLTTDFGHLLLRKAAHFSEFAILGVLLTWLWGMLAGNPLLRFLLPLGCGMACAVTDECIQLFSPGRACSFWDMCIDWSGVLTGISIFMLCQFIIHKRKKKAL